MLFVFFAKPSTNTACIIVVCESCASKSLFDVMPIHVCFCSFRCRFSQMLAPIFDQASDLVHEEYPVSLRAIFFIILILFITVAVYSRMKQVI